jgi:hypothetical protein
VGEGEVEMTDERPWCVEDLKFERFAEGRERATINGVVVVRQNGKYTITGPGRPIWEDKDTKEANDALHYLYDLWLQACRSVAKPR